MASPAEFLSGIIGKQVVVKLNSGVEYKDGYMNIVMEQTEEFVEGKLRQKYGDAFIRGSNVFYITPQA